MSTEIRIALAESMARTLGFKQIIVFGHGGTDNPNEVVITTWGDTAEHAAQAAAGANYVKKLWGWPEDTIVESAKVTALREELAEVYARYDELVAKHDKATAGPRPKPTVHVIEGTEYERGWGCRPDGIVAFKSKEDAETWIASYNAAHNTAKTAPDEYTVYQYIGIHECSEAVFAYISEKGYRHASNKRELLA